MSGRSSPVSQSSADSRDLRAEVTQAFSQRFGVSADLLVRAPGRVNLIGEHTDYNDGFVLPMAIERAVWIALRARNDGMVSVYSADFGEQAEFDARAPTHGGPAWGEYLQASAAMLIGAGHSLSGWDAVMASDVPIGAGLSSSAAVELATMRAFSAVSRFGWDAKTMAQLAQRGENEWVGVQCGIMDQMISAVGQEGHAVLIDCRSLDTSAVPLPANITIVILDTATRRGLVDSAYNERRQQCEAAARHFGVDALRDVTPEMFEQHSASLDPLTRRRARHVITENARTLRAADAMRRADARALGAEMNASHESLRDDFEVSNDALDTMVDIARAQEGCIGARMTGAGFGGCAVAAVENTHAEHFARAVREEYHTRTGREARVYVTGASNGASVE